MYTLFLDTHDEFIKVALVNEEKVILREQESEKSHSIYLIPMIKEVMEENNVRFDDIKSIVGVNGPGSFTGIRVGLSALKAIGYARKIPIYLISSLTAILVSNHEQKDKMAVIKDSKGFYISVFNKDNNVIVPECYKENIDDFKDKYEIIGMDYDVKSIVNYALKTEEVNVYSVKANYVKTIEVMNDRC